MITWLRSFFTRMLEGMFGEDPDVPDPSAIEWWDSHGWYR